MLRGMAHKKTTSKRVARIASKALRNPTASKKFKSVSGAALSQSPGKHKKKR